MRWPRAGAAVLALACGLVGACGSSPEGEHTATVVRGTYGDPNPLVPCDPGADASPDAAAPTGRDASPDGC